MSVCRGCGATIEWKVTTKGKRMPIDPDPVADGQGNLVKCEGKVKVVAIGQGTHVAHWATCPDSESFRAKP